MGIDGDRLGPGDARLEVVLDWSYPEAACRFEGEAGPDGRVSWTDSGGALAVVIDGTVDGPIVGSGATCDDELVYAEVSVSYANASFDVDSSFVDRDGARCRHLLRSNWTGVASATVVTDDGTIIDAMGSLGSGGYSREEFICPPPRAS